MNLARSLPVVAATAGASLANAVAGEWVYIPLGGADAGVDDIAGVP